MALNFLGGLQLNEHMNTKKLPLTAAFSAPLLTYAMLFNAKPIVLPNDEVFCSSIIAQNDDGFCIMSTVSGRIVSADNEKIIVQNNYKGDSIQLFDKINLPLTSLSSVALIDYIKKCGIVDAFSGIPVYQKCQSSYGTIQRVIINCTESDPCSGHVRSFIRKNAKGIVLGTKILLQTLGVKRAVLAVNSRDEDVVEAFTPYISEKGMIVFAPVAPKYPQGNEHLLISSIYKIEVPLTSPTEKSGYAVFSAETIFNIYDCLINTRAVINKAVTVTGDAIYKNENLYITIGSQFSEALAHCDGFKETDHTIINGGILNGIETDENDFISPTTNEIIALKQKEPKNGQCVRCSRCSMVCPIHLAPYRLSENYLNGKHDENLAIGLYNCIECGCCSFVCIGNVDILGNIRNDKACITPLEQENEKKSNYNKLGKMRAFFGKKTKEVSPSKADAIKVALQGISLDPIPDESKSESDFEDISETSSQTLQKILQETTADSTDETKNDSYAHTNFDKNKTANLFIPGEDDIDELDTEKDQQIEYDTKIYGADDDK